VAETVHTRSLRMWTDFFGAQRPLDEVRYSNVDAGLDWWAL
jgi:hypothetical protein